MISMMTILVPRMAISTSSIVQLSCWHWCFCWWRHWHWRWSQVLPRSRHSSLASWSMHWQLHRPELSWCSPSIHSSLKKKNISSKIYFSMYHPYLDKSHPHEHSRSSSSVIFEHSLLHLPLPRPHSPTSTGITLIWLLADKQSFPCLENRIVK